MVMSTQYIVYRGWVTETRRDESNLGKALPKYRVNGCVSSSNPRIWIWKLITPISVVEQQLPPTPPPLLLISSIGGGRPDKYKRFSDQLGKVIRSLIKLVNTTSDG